MSITKTVQALADALKGNPLAAALVLINLLFVAAAVLILRDVAANARQRDQAEVKLLEKILADCTIRK